MDPYFESISVEKYTEMETFLESLMTKENVEKMKSVDTWKRRVLTITAYVTQIYRYVMEGKCDIDINTLQAYARKHRKLVVIILSKHFKRSEQELEVFHFWITSQFDLTPQCMYSPKPKSTFSVR